MFWNCFPYSYNCAPYNCMPQNCTPYSYGYPGSNYNCMPQNCAPYACAPFSGGLNNCWTPNSFLGSTPGFSGFGGSPQNWQGLGNLWNCAPNCFEGFCFPQSGWNWGTQPSFGTPMNSWNQGFDYSTAWNFGGFPQGVGSNWSTPFFGGSNWNWNGLGQQLPFGFGQQFCAPQGFQGGIGQNWNMPYGGFPYQGYSQPQNGYNGQTTPGFNPSVVRDAA